MSRAAIKRRDPCAAVFLLALLLALAGAGNEGLAISQEAQPQEQPAAAAAAATPRGHLWLDAEGNPLPFQSEDEIANFLLTADVKKMKEIGKGITVPKKALLEKDGVRMNAVFKDLDQEKPKGEFASGRIEIGFRDSYLFEPAAYELSRLLGLNIVPPAVKRKVWGKSGALQIWLEKGMTEEERRNRKIEPLDQTRWNYQMWRIHVFTALVQDTDPNLGNFMIDGNWFVWHRDYTRAFRRHPKVENINLLQHCERSLLEKLRTLDETTIRERLKPYLRSGEIDALLKRRQELVAHFEKLIQERGEGAVLYVLSE